MKMKVKEIKLITEDGEEIVINIPDYCDVSAIELHANQHIHYESELHNFDAIHLLAIHSKRIATSRLFEVLEPAIKSL